MNEEIQSIQFITKLFVWEETQKAETSKTAEYRYRMSWNLTKSLNGSRKIFKFQRKHSKVVHPFHVQTDLVCVLCNIKNRSLQKKN